MNNLVNEFKNNQSSEYEETINAILKENQSFIEDADYFILTLSELIIELTDQESNNERNMKISNLAYIIKHIQVVKKLEGNLKTYEKLKMIA